jgi:hypothetical protein
MRAHAVATVLVAHSLRRVGHQHWYQLAMGCTRDDCTYQHMVLQGPRQKLAGCRLLLSFDARGSKVLHQQLHDRQCRGDFHSDAPDAIVRQEGGSLPPPLLNHT